MAQHVVKVTKDDVEDWAQRVHRHCNNDAAGVVVVKGSIDTGFLKQFQKVHPDHLLLLGSLLEETDLNTVKHMCRQALTEKLILVIDGRCTIDVINEQFQELARSMAVIYIHNDKIEKIG